MTLRKKNKKGAHKAMRKPIKHREKAEKSNKTRESIEKKERRKTSFPREQLENADFYKRVLNKTKTTHE